MLDEILLLYPSKEEAKQIKHRAAYNKWYKNHPEKQRARITKWLKTPQGKVSVAKQQSKRKREMGHDLLNTWFAGCAQHHINAQQVVCIPADLHKAHSHNHKKPDTMVDINRIAMQYIFNYKV